MNRFLFYTLFVLLAVSTSSCVKKQIVVNRLEGTWTHSKTLFQNGSYEYYTSKSVIFSGGKADGSTYLDLVYTDTTQTNGKYLVDKRGDYIYLMPDTNFPGHVDTLVIEDMDKNSLIVRSPNGIRFYDKN